MLKRLLPVPLVLVVLIAAGCGGGSDDSSEDFKGPQKDVASAVEDFEDAGRDRDEDEICKELFAQTLLNRLKQAGTNCTTAVEDALDDADNLDIEVDKVTITGNAARVEVTSGDGDQEKKDVLRLEKEGAKWKIAALSEQAG